MTGGWQSVHLHRSEEETDLGVFLEVSEDGRDLLVLFDGQLCDGRQNFLGQSQEV